MKDNIKTKLTSIITLVCACLCSINLTQAAPRSVKPAGSSVQGKSPAVSLSQGKPMSSPVSVVPLSPSLDNPAMSTNSALDGMYAVGKFGQLPMYLQIAFFAAELITIEDILVQAIQGDEVKLATLKEGNLQKIKAMFTSILDTHKTAKEIESDRIIAKMEIIQEINGEAEFSQYHKGSIRKIVASINALQGLKGKVRVQESGSSDVKDQDISLRNYALRMCALQVLKRPYPDKILQIASN